MPASIIESSSLLSGFGEAGGLGSIRRSMAAHAAPVVQFEETDESEDETSDGSQWETSEDERDSTQIPLAFKAKGKTNVTAGKPAAAAVAASFAAESDHSESEGESDASDSDA